jgi:hypothetical protein
MTDFTFQNRNVLLTDVKVTFPEWFPDADAHILWMALNQARDGAAGSAGKIMVSLLENAYKMGYQSVLDVNIAKALLNESEDTDYDNMGTESLERAFAEKFPHLADDYRWSRKAMIHELKRLG